MAHLPAATKPHRSVHPNALCSRRLCRRVLTLTSLGLAGLVAGLLSGCSSTAATSNPISGDPVTSFAAVSGNWRFTAAAPPAANALSVLGGSLSVSGLQVSGLLHALTPGQCLDPAETIAVSGSITSAGALTLTGQSTGQTGAQTSLTVTGLVAADRQSLSTATLSATGSHCTAARPEDNTGTAQQYQPVFGTYTGTLATAEGETFPLTTTVTQLDQPDTSGVYHLKGSATSAGNTCLPNTVTATASILSGGALSATYTDANSTTAITATGSASPDASTLTLSHWQIASACGSDTGTGTLTRQ